MMKPTYTQTADGIYVPYGVGLSAPEAARTPIVVPPTLTSLPEYLQRLVEESTRKHWWWDRTLNAHRGCDEESTGCLNCWCLELIKAKLAKNMTAAYANGSEPTFHPEVLDALQRDLRPKRYFTPSMSDPYHGAYSDETVFTFFDALARAPWHWFFVLTKRSERLAELGPHLPWPDHVIAVVSVENERYLHRIDHLRACGAKRIGVSFEPLIGRIPLDTVATRRRYVRGLDYAIIGGESAAEDKVRPMLVEYAREVCDACLAEGVPVFFKQVGDVNFDGKYVGKKQAGRLLDGRTHDDLPRGCAEHLLRAQLLAAAEKVRRSNRRG